MDNDRKGKGKQATRATPPRRDYEVAYYTKELGRPLQREMLASRLAALKDEGAQRPSTHGEDAADAPPRRPAWDDRAG